MTRTHPLTARTCRQRGFSFVDLLVAMAILTIGLLTQVSGAVSNHELMAEQTGRTHGIAAAKQFVAELRADEDWAGLYDRLRLRQTQAEAGAAPLTLSRGGSAWPPQTYYPTFVNPPGIADLGFLVQLPPALAPTKGGPPCLREDQVLAAFGLPADLNADTHIDGDSRNADYLVLPLILRVRWRAQGGGSQELTLPVWLRGER